MEGHMDQERDSRSMITTSQFTNQRQKDPIPDLRVFFFANSFVFISTPLCSLTEKKKPTGPLSFSFIQIIFPNTQNYHFQMLLVRSEPDDAGGGGGIIQL